MLCQRCHKNEATIHVQQIVNGKIKASHLCQQCAAKDAEFPDENGINLAEILLNLADKVAGSIAQQDKAGTTESEEYPAEHTEICPVCGWDLEHFRKTGYLGCPECYKSFEAYIQPMLKNLHRGEIHTGKTPVNTDIDRKAREQSLHQRQIALLQKEMELHVSREEYEDAARIRDEIRKLNECLHTGDRKHDA